MLTRVVTVLVVAAALAVMAARPALASAPSHAAEKAEANAPAEEGGHSGGGINPLGFNPDLAIFTGVIFLLLLAVLWKLAWRPIADGLDKREQRVRAEITAAEQANADARRVLDDYQKKLAASESEVREILERGRREAEQIGREMLDKARAETEAEKQRALREIDTATSGALKELAERSAALAVQLAGRIVQARLDPAAHARLIDEAVSRFASPKSNGGK